MQSNKTIDFWNEYHEQESAKEWILIPSASLLTILEKELLHVVPSSHPSVLEIGCGSSTLARDFYVHTGCHIVSTDVSSICIESNQRRDQSWIDSSGGKFSYAVLNVLLLEDEIKKPFHMVLDKGCLDTFLFRSKQQVQMELLRKLFDNVHRWLVDGGKYLVLSPRKNFTQLRDFKGFTAITRKRMDETNAVLGDLDGNSVERIAVYMHVCVKNSSYVPGIGPAFDNVYNGHTCDDACCSGCGISFVGFRKCEAMEGRGQLYWKRKWMRHQEHCQNKKNKIT